MDKPPETACNFLAFFAWAGIWSLIRERYRIELFSGFFMKESNEGVIISPKTLLALGERGIELGLDIYAPIPEEES